MFAPKHSLTWFAALFLTAAGWCTPHVSAQNEAPPDQQITLKQQLEFGLRARRPQEFAYIQTIVNLVESDDLPRRLVNISYLWSRKKSRYPLTYFSRALFILGQREGIVVPPGPY